MPSSSAGSASYEGDSQPSRPRSNGRILLVLGLMNLVDCINVNIIVPYVEDLMSMLMNKPVGDPDLDLYISLLIGLYSICECLFSYMWGALADRIGRRPALLIGIAGSAVAPIIMGTATTVPQAFFARALDGFFCGNAGVSKAYLGEIVEPGNEARGFSFLALCFSCGLILGPIFGGHLSRPADAWPDIFSGTIFDTYPFLLPNLSYAMFAVLAFVVGATSLKETLPAEKRKPLCPRRHSDQRSLALANTSSQGHGERPLAPPLLQEDCVEDTTIAPAQVAVDSHAEVSVCGLRNLRWSAMCVCLVGSAYTAWMQLFAILTSADLDQMGFRLSEREIGTLNLFAAGGLMMTQLLLYPYFCKRFGYFAAFKLGIAASLLVILPFPLYTLMADPDKFGYWRYLPLAVCQAVSQAGAGFLFPTIFVWINRSADSAVKGRANGMVNTVSACSRGTWPLVCAAVLQVLSRSSFPVWLRFFVFVQNSAPLILGLFVIRLLPAEFSGLAPPKPTASETDADALEQGA